MNYIIDQYQQIISKKVGLNLLVDIEEHKARKTEVGLEY